MRNVSPSSPRPPSRVPRRGLAALVLTAAGVTLLFSFKTPAELVSDESSVPPGPGNDTADAALAPSPRDGGGPATRGSAGQPAPEPPRTGQPAPEPPATKPPASTPAATPGAPSVVTGQVVRTPYGPVQVEITLVGSAISDIQALQLPSDRSYSRRISEVVEPMLRQEALQVQGSRIHLISGATYTSTGYAMSLQSALDQAPAAMDAAA